MILSPTRIRASARLLALVVALAVAALPFLPRPVQHFCRMSGMVQAVCCCAASDPAPASSDQRPTGKPAAGKGGCCEAMTVEQPQAVAAAVAPLPAPVAVAAAALVALLPEPSPVLAMPAAEPDPCPDGPPRRIRWCSFQI